MKKDFCEAIAWYNIPTESLIKIYCDMFSLDCTHKKILEGWAETHEKSCRFFIKCEIKKIHCETELVKKSCFSDYNIVCPYISFDFQGSTIELPIDKGLIEEYNGYNPCWPFWASFYGKCGEEYVAEISAEYDAENEYGIDVKGEVDVYIYEGDEDEPFMEFKTNVLNID